MKIALVINRERDVKDMVRRLTERIIQLYTDKVHFIYELLQNAEDAGASHVKFIQYEDRLELFHDGKPFTYDNLRSLCSIAESDKIRTLNNIGEFGVGFKSVFSICKTVKLYSAPRHFRKPSEVSSVPFAIEILNFYEAQDIDEEIIEDAYTTRFVFPYAIGEPFSGFESREELKSELSDRLKDLGISTLLFMRNLQSIEYQIHANGKVWMGEYALEIKSVGENCSLVSARGYNTVPEGETCQSEGEIEDVAYLKFTGKRKDGDVLEKGIDIAFPVKVLHDGKYECLKPLNPYISVYFPTETESKLNFIVQGPFRTTPNRTSVPEKENVKLAKETAIFVKDCMRKMKEMKILNLSFVSALVVPESNFNSFGLFEELNKDVKALFASWDSYIPTNSGGYVTASRARLVRSEKLLQLIPDELLSELMDDGKKYHWLPSCLTETSKDYEYVYKFLTSELKIKTIRPDDLGCIFDANPYFLPRRSNEWLVDLYTLLESVPNAFSETKSGGNMLTSRIIKTVKGEFVAAYKKEKNQYIQNVYPPTAKSSDVAVHVIDANIYYKCPSFFDKVLRLEKLDEFSHFCAYLEKAYFSAGYSGNSVSRYFDDLQAISVYLRDGQYKNKLIEILNKGFPVLCKDGVYRKSGYCEIFATSSPSGIDNIGYLLNVASGAYFVDLSRYLEYNISTELLNLLKIRLSPICGEDEIKGKDGNVSWSTEGAFRKNLSMKFLQKVLRYISQNPHAKDSLLKSKAIFSILKENDSALCGVLNVKGEAKKEKEECMLIKILKGSQPTYDWDGRWLYSSSGALVSPKDISASEINTCYYGSEGLGPKACELLKLKKKVEELLRGVPQTEVDAYLDGELKRRCGYTLEELLKKKERLPESEQQEPEFPIAIINDWNRIKIHTAELFAFASPVEYQYVLRRIHISKPHKYVQEYVRNMYRYDMSDGYACQRCQRRTTDVEAVQLSDRMIKELDPLHLCLCRNCAAKYRRVKNNFTLMHDLKCKIMRLTDWEISSTDSVMLEVGDMKLRFTQVHIAEIRELLRLLKENNL